jgi:two-component system LytT family response regulator
MTRTDTLRTIVVEDERLAREELTGLLRQFACIDLVGEAADLASARTLLQQAKPQLLFLDVQLGDGSGFDLLDGTAAFDGHVVFVTAYEAFALRAFEVNALDYLLKPIQRDRLKAAIERARAAAVPAENGVLSYDDYVFLRLGEGSAFVAVSSILAITADGDYTVVHTAEGHAYLVLKPVKQWEARLPGNAFVRIHRSTIVNLRKVSRLESWFNHGYRVFVDGLSKPLTMSRRYRHRLSDRFG